MITVLQKCLFALAGLLLITSIMTAGTIILEGNYQGKNLYVQNPFSGTGVGFCVYEVKVNGEVTTDEIYSSAFEIDLANFQLKIGDKVVVVIQHKDDCRPRVLNPEVLKPKSTCQYMDVTINDNTLQWKTKDEAGKLPFIIEQFRWNKWIKIGEVEGKGTPAENSYNFKISPHSGENLFRVKQCDYTEGCNISKSARFRSTKEEVTLLCVKCKEQVELSGETMFEIYDAYGNIVKKGFAQNIDVSNFKKGIYYINFDNKTEQFIKK